MKEILRTYNTQFKFQPEIVNEHLVRKSYKQIIICGMGGSHLAAGILKTIEPGVDIYVHRDYDIPPFSKAFLESSLIIASSYSGNTEEVLSFYKKIKQLYELPVCCISLGGDLIELAQKNNDPYILLPQTEFVPRTALGITAIALAYLLKDKDIFYRLQNLALDIPSIEQSAQKIGDKIKDKTPIFYASNQNLNLAYNWKIKCNETAKQMAFYNVFPEANHNELEAYEFLQGTQIFLPVLLRDQEDAVRIQKRFDVFKDILNQKNMAFLEIDISNLDVCKKVFNTIILGDFVSAYIAETKQYPQAQVPLIEDFKNKLV
jgi:glucose/mannose-6-phosphate isomerase